MNATGEKTLETRRGARFDVNLALCPSAGRFALLGIADGVRRTRVSRALRDLGCAVSMVDDGLSLMERIADAILDGTRACRPSLIVIDSHFPVGAGRMLLAGLEDLRWEIPVVLVCDRLDSVTGERTWISRVTGVVVEPLDTERLRDVLRTLLEPRTTRPPARARISLVPRHHSPDPRAVH